MLKEEERAVVEAAIAAHFKSGALRFHACISGVIVSNHEPRGSLIGVMFDTSGQIAIAYKLPEGLCIKMSTTQAKACEMLLAWARTGKSILPSDMILIGGPADCTEMQKKFEGQQVTAVA